MIFTSLRVSSAMYFCLVYKLILKPLFFLFSPERAHYLAMDLLQAVCAVPGMKALLYRMYRPSSPSREVQIAGLTFPNVVGLAAGFDKDARWVDALECLGFGFIEIGTVTPLAQPGNDKPRLFRLPQDEALINRMGFNNGGAAAAADRLRKRKGRVIIGGNIGKNKVTPNEQATDDYVKCFHALRDTVDYFVVNVSSPNTPGLRELQDKAPLLALLRTLQQLNTQSGTFRPIFLKIAPDLTESQLDDIISIIAESGIAGVIATNTTISREGLHTPGEAISAIGAGGLSGKPVRERSTEVVRYICQKSQGRIPVIAVGGIANGKDAEEKLKAGASLVQVYTGFIYEGPSIAKRILNYLNQRV
jgi:dihydroorotate dehydrogenase